MNIHFYKSQRFRKFIVTGRAHMQLIVVVLIVVFGFIRPFLVEAYRIPSGSMEDTLLIGDQILVCKFIYGIKIPGTNIKVFDIHKPDRGDVCVFIPPHDRERFFIKRIVAVEGDTVETRGKTLYVNGESIDDSHYTKHLALKPFRTRRRDFPPFRHPESLPNNDAFSDYTLTVSQFSRKFPEGKPFTVPKGMIFVMGDNRDQSSDSRFWGPVDVNDIKGQAFMVYFSFQNRPISPWEFWKVLGQVRFRRIGKRIDSEYGASHTSKESTTQ